MEKGKLGVILIVLAIVIAIISVGISMSDENTEPQIQSNTGQGAQGEISFAVTNTTQTNNTQTTQNGTG